MWVCAVMKISQKWNENKIIIKYNLVFQFIPCQNYILPWNYLSCIYNECVCVCVLTHDMNSSGIAQAKNIYIKKQWKWIETGNKINVECTFLHYIYNRIIANLCPIIFSSAYILICALKSTYTSCVCVCVLPEFAAHNELKWLKYLEIISLWRFCICGKMCFKSFLIRVKMKIFWYFGCF